MHELSIALSIIEGVEQEALRQGGGSVLAVHLNLGALSGVVKEALLFSWQIACEATSIEGANLVIKDIPVVVYCPRCRAERTLTSIQHFFCPVCESATPEVLQGKELEVVALEME